LRGAPSTFRFEHVWLCLVPHKSASAPVVSWCAAAISFPTGGIDTELQGTRNHRGRGTNGVLIPPSGVLGDGRYELRGVLGRGGMAEVHDGWDLKLRRAVAIKLLYPEADARPDGRPRFEAEARASAQLVGRHVVVVHDVGEHHGAPFIVMERLPGVSLANHIARGPIPPPFVQYVLDCVLDALAEAHGVGILHRDVKPGNILFTATGEPKLADFGIAKTSGTAYTRTGEIVGTLAYLSPERLCNQPATVADDLYAVGVVGYEALGGRRPFPQNDLGPLAHAILHDSPSPLAELRPDAPPALVATIERAMARDSARRFGQASAMRAAMVGPTPAPVLGRRGTKVLESPPPYLSAGARPERDTSSNRKLLLVALLALFVLAFLLFLLVGPFSASLRPTPAHTSTPLPPPTTAVTTTPGSFVPDIPLPSFSLPPIPPIPQGPPGHGPGGPGGKRKGGGGGD
jgi:serine/threonine protein kinase